LFSKNYWPLPQSLWRNKWTTPKHVEKNWLISKSLYSLLVKGRYTLDIYARDIEILR
jgi:hypothetical protein